VPDANELCFSRDGLSPDPSRSRSPRQPQSFSLGRVGSRRQGRIE